jgi:hypothetical protein
VGNDVKKMQGMIQEMTDLIMLLWNENKNNE